MQRKFNLIISFLFSLLLAACSGGMSFSPADAARNALLNHGDPNFQIDANSVKVVQTQTVKQDQAVVLLTFKGIRQGNPNPENCIYTYLVMNRQFFGWQPSSGGGGCGTPPDPANQQGIEFGAGQSTTDQPGDTGFSEVHGIIHQTGIVKVRVTWDDGQNSVVDVVNTGFVAYRFGKVTMKSITGMNEKGESVYEYAPEFGPGKKE